MSSCQPCHGSNEKVACSLHHGNQAKGSPGSREDGVCDELKGRQAQEQSHRDTCKAQDNTRQPSARMTPHHAVRPWAGLSEEGRALPGAPMRASREALFMENTSRARYPHITIGSVVLRR